MNGDWEKVDASYMMLETKPQHFEVLIICNGFSSSL